MSAQAPIRIIRTQALRQLRGVEPLGVTAAAVQPDTEAPDVIAESADFSLHLDSLRPAQAHGLSQWRA